MDFYELVKHPPAALIADYPWLKTILADAPKGASLEGFLWPAHVPRAAGHDARGARPADARQVRRGRRADRLAVPKARGLNFYQVLTLASIVEREAVLDEERPLIAGVYQNRIDGIPGHQEQDPQRRPDRALRDRHRRARQAQLRRLAALHVLDAAGRAARRASPLPEDLLGLQDVPRRPASSPARSPRRACRRSTPRWSRTPPTSYIYFLAIPDGAGAHVFAKTQGRARREPGASTAI